MTSLYIDDELVVLPKETKIKLIFDNPIIKKSSGYTRDIRIPLNCNQNKRIFNFIHRMEVKKNVTTRDAKLLVKDQVLLEGKAVIREIKEEEVSIQLLAENSSFNFIANGESYIDELDFGEEGIMKYPGLRQEFTPTEGMALYGPYRYQTALTPSKRVNYVYMPIFNESAGEIYNKIAGYYYNDKMDEGFYQELFYKHLCPQPYLLWVIQEVLYAIGYYISTNDLMNSPFVNTYICNATVTNRLNDVLPHWKVLEFIEEIEKLFNVIFIVKRNVVWIRDKNKYFEESGTVELKEVLDEYSSDINPDEDRDITENNIAYELVSSDIDSWRYIDPEVLAGYDIVQGGSMVELNTLKYLLSEEERFKRLYTCLNRQYVLVKKEENDKHGEFREINQFRNLIRDQKNSDAIKLKIVPAATVVERANAVIKNGGGKPVFSFPVLMPCMQGAIYERPSGDTPTLQQVLDGYSEDTHTKGDVMEVAFNDMTLNNTRYPQFGAEADKTVGYPVSYTDYNQYPGIPKIGTKEKNSFMLIQEAEGNNIGKRMESNIHFDTRVAYHFQFISKEILDSKSIFFIKNQKYVAKNIEVEVTSEGINPLQKAEMYRLSV